MEEVIAFGALNPKKKKAKKKKSYKGNPKKKKKGRRRRASKKLIEPGTNTKLLGLGGGLIAADIGLKKLSARFGKEDPTTKVKTALIVPGTMADVAATVGVGFGLKYIAQRFLKNARLGEGAFYGATAIGMLKLLGTGKEEPLGDKIAVGYGSKLRSMFAGGVGQDDNDIIFIPEGDVGALPEEEGSMLDDVGQESAYEAQPA